MNLQELSYRELQQEAGRLGLPANGKAVELIERIEAHLEGEEEALPKEEEERIVREIHQNHGACVVRLPDGTERRYSARTHGKVWRALAENYKEANDGAEIV